MAVNRGLTWSAEEVQFLIDIWAEENISSMLDTTHKNTAVFKIFSDRLREKGFNRTIEQCRAKLKKLSHLYVKTRDSLNRSGSSGEERERFPWYDDLDNIMGTKPVVKPVDMVESAEGNDSLITNMSDDEETGPTEPELANSSDAANKVGERLAIPDSQSRKRKARNSQDELQQLLAEQRQFMKDMMDAERAQRAEEAADFSNMRMAQQEAEERRFQAMQAQHQATNSMFMQVMSNLTRALHQQPHYTVPMPPHILPFQSRTPQPPAQASEVSDISSVLHEVNTTQNLFYN
ncbi:hypothetical protein ACEWY4_025591 [Coilia grayii]|uniref:Myb/SANT-like DNA-binding domain-containing protein n=1 Tax=Coilia grayii TaxID=363190 RepID=A0ABD1ISH2_9TELE